MAYVELVKVRKIDHDHRHVAAPALPTDATAVVVGIRGEWFAISGFDWATPYQFDAAG